MDDENVEVSVHPVVRENWRAVRDLTVSEAQREFVAEPSHYLALCCYEDIWHPLAVYAGGEVVGFLMWGIDSADDSCWLGGILIDHRHQGRGYGRRAILVTLDMLNEAHGLQRFTLSYLPGNEVARRLYGSLGFVETGEWADDEMIARLSLGDPAS